jgi:argininosuccinate lyase
MPLWGGRFSQSLDQQAWKLNASIQYDHRLAAQDVRGSRAWAAALGQAGVIKAVECDEIIAGLETIQGEFHEKMFQFVESDEDIHTAVERRLGELIGPVAGKLHTGRSRNDQVATDMRLWLMDETPRLEEKLKGLQAVLVKRAESDFSVIMPGYTHLQRAQPILLSHWWLSHFWPLQRDCERLVQLVARSAVMPLGAAALAGTSFPINRIALADKLGFVNASPNSLDAVSDRDFVAEFLFWAALTAVHLSKLAEAIVLFTSAEFHFLELDDAFATGSSLMPQKKNADVFELTRGKAGTLIGKLTGILSVLKGLPSTYDKDLQEDKLAVFEAYDTLSIVLPVIASALETITVFPEIMRAAISPGMMATDLADYLVSKDVPFRKAHELVGIVVKQAIEQGTTIDKLKPEAYQQISPLFDDNVYEVLRAENSIVRHNVSGGTAPEAVQKQVEVARHALSGQDNNKEKKS